jgi:hypothetical protein
MINKQYKVSGVGVQVSGISPLAAGHWPLLRVARCRLRGEYQSNQKSEIICPLPSALRLLSSDTCLLLSDT